MCVQHYTHCKYVSTYACALYSDFDVDIPTYVTYGCIQYIRTYCILLALHQFMLIHSTSRNPRYNDLLAVGHGICECGTSIMHHFVVFSCLHLCTEICNYVLV